jgi:hypothetical protein
MVEETDKISFDDVFTPDFLKKCFIVIVLVLLVFTAGFITGREKSYLEAREYYVKQYEMNCLLFDDNKIVKGQVLPYNISINQG